MKDEDRFVVYQTKSGKIELLKEILDGSVLGNLDQISKLFARDKSVISRHIKNIFLSCELDKSSVVAKIATPAYGGKNYKIDDYF